MCAGHGIRMEKHEFFIELKGLILTAPCVSQKFLCELRAFQKKQRAMGIPGRASEISPGKDSLWEARCLRMKLCHRSSAFASHRPGSLQQDTEAAQGHHRVSENRRKRR